MKKQKIFGVFIASFFFGLFFLIPQDVVFSAEDISKLIDQGNQALARRDYAQALSTGMRIRNEDPRNLNGYKFILIYCVATGKDVAFHETLNDAKKQGVPELVIEKLAIDILFVSGHAQEVSWKLTEYEKKWCEAYDRAR